MSNAVFGHDQEFAVEKKLRNRHELEKKSTNIVYIIEHLLIIVLLFLFVFFVVCM